MQPPIDMAVIGVPKSGTTSLYTWLASHPDVQGSEPKETYYFIDVAGWQPEVPTFDDEGGTGSIASSRTHGTDA